MDWQKIFPKWNEEDARCPECGSVTKKTTGITKQNVKKLFSCNFKDPQEIIFTFIVIMLIFLGWRYNVEVKQCREIQNLYNMELGIGRGGVDEIYGLNVSQDVMDLMKNETDECNNETCPLSSTSGYTER